LEISNFPPIPYSLSPCYTISMQYWQLLLHPQNSSLFTAPERYTAGLLIIIGFIFLAQIAALILEKVFKRMAKKTATNLDDRIIALLRKPIIYLVVLLGFHLSFTVFPVNEQIKFFLINTINSIVIAVFAIAALCFGGVVGSFLNVVILRLPAGASIAYPASHCPVCKTPIRWYDNIPVFSYLVLQGRCRSCRMSISLQYPLVELCMALLSLALYTRFGPSFEFFFYFLFLAALLAVIFIDIHHQIIPDVISLPGIVIGFAGSFINAQVTWQESGIGLLVGGGILYAVALGYYLLTRREGMGGGDIKLLGMIGAFLGWQSLLFVVFFSSLTGSMVGILAMLRQGRGGRTRIPFGPFLSLAAMLYLFFQAEIMQLWQAYLALSG